MKLRKHLSDFSLKIASKGLIMKSVRAKQHQPRLFTLATRHAQVLVCKGICLPVQGPCQDLLVLHALADGPTDALRKGRPRVDGVASTKRLRGQIPKLLGPCHLCPVVWIPRRVLCRLGYSVQFRSVLRVRLPLRFLGPSVEGVKGQRALPRDLDVDSRRKASVGRSTVVCAVPHSLDVHDASNLVRADHVVQISGSDGVERILVKRGTKAASRVFDSVFLDAFHDVLSPLPVCVQLRVPLRVDVLDAWRVGRFVVV